MGGQPVPQQGGLLAAQEPPQSAQDLDEGVGVVGTGLDVEGKLGAAARYDLAARGRHRRLLNGCTSIGGWPRGAQVRRTLGVRLSARSSKTTRQALCRWAFPLIGGHRSLTHRSIAAWSRSAARRTGRCTAQPSRWRSSAQMRAGWWRTPVRRSITMAIRSRVHSSPVNPLAVAPSSRACSTRPSSRSDSRGMGPVGPRLSRSSEPPASQRACQSLTL
jgi:hypothetical protein